MSHPLAALISVTLALIAYGPLFVLGFIGLANYVRYARSIGIPPWGFNAFSIYSQAVRDRGTSPLARRMLFGYIGMFVWLFVGQAIFFGVIMLVRHATLGR